MDAVERLGSDGATGDLTVGELYGLLADDTRRAVLCHLHESGACPPDELVSALTDGVDGDERIRVAVELHEEHLPALVDAGLVTHDELDDEVALGFLPSWVHDLLDLTARVES